MGFTTPATKEWQIPEPTPFLIPEEEPVAEPLEVPTEPELVPAGG